MRPPKRRPTSPRCNAGRGGRSFKATSRSACALAKRSDFVVEKSSAHFFFVLLPEKLRRQGFAEFVRHQTFDDALGFEALLVVRVLKLDPHPGRLFLRRLL